MNLPDLSGGLAPLVNYRQWLCWRLSMREGKQTKIPIDPHTGAAASSTDPTTWTDASTALQFAQQNPGHGLGFVFTTADPFFFVDIDSCYDGASWSPIAHELLQRFAGGFVEVSQSMRGLHIIATGRKPDGCGAKSDAGFDIYQTGRFVALTGTMAVGSADAQLQAALDECCGLYLGRDTSTSAEWSDKPDADWRGPEDDAELLRRALASGNGPDPFGMRKATFAQLWAADADVLRVAYPHDQDPDKFDHSAADAACLQHLAFWTGKNCERMDRLFRQSALMRDKWEQRPDYRERSILNAISLCRQVYRDSSAPLPPEQVQAVVENLQPPVTGTPVNVPWRQISPGDMGYDKGHTNNASRFLQTYYPMGTLAVVQEQAFRYNGRVWERVDDETLKHELTIAMLASNPNRDVVNGTLSILKNLCCRPGLVHNTWPGQDASSLIVVQNGILDVCTGQLYQHSQHFFTTCILPFAYDPAGRCPQWLHFLAEIFDGDPERIALLQEWIGYMLVQNYDYQKAMMFIGASRSGKGTIGKVLEALSGAENFAGITLEGLANDAVLETITEKRVLFIGDAHSVSGPSRSAILDRFKSITGNDSLPINRKFKSAWNGRIPGRITIAANNLLAFNDDSGALTNRFLILAFNNSYLGREDTFLSRKLLAELPGICNWAIDGLHRLRTNGRFTEPRASVEERDEMTGRWSPLTAFVSEHCLWGRDLWVTSEDLYNAYVAWCVADGQRHRMSQSQFARAMRDTFRGRVTKKQKTFTGDGGKPVGRMAFFGISLREPVAVPGNVTPIGGVAQL